MFARLGGRSQRLSPQRRTQARISESSARRQKSRLTTAAEVAGIISLVVAVVVGFVKSPDPTNDSDASTTAAPVATTSANAREPVNGPFEFELFDDFGDSTIDPKRWLRGEGFDSVPPLIYTQDGLLHMQVTKEHGSGVNSVALRASLPRPARAISFEMTPLSNDGINDGGGYAVVSSRDSHNHKLIMGPDGNGFPSAGYYICDNELGCDDGVYEDFEHPGGNQLQLEQPYNVLVYQSDTGWFFQIDGFPKVTAGLEEGPIENLEFYLYSFGEGVFHVAVDNVKIDYAT